MKKSVWKAVKINETDVDMYDLLYVEIMENNTKYTQLNIIRPPKQSEGK